MRVANDTIISTATGTDWGLPWVSEPILIEHTLNYSIQLAWSGTVQGMTHLQCSNDPGVKSAIATWTDIEGTEQLVSAPGSHTWQVANAGYMWVQVIWTPTQGVGSINSARFTKKGV